MSDDFKSTLDAIQNAVTELRRESDAKFDAIEKKGGSDPLIDEKLGRINDAITDLQKKAARPAIAETEADQAASEHKSAFNKWARKGVGEAELEAAERKSFSIAGDGSQGGYALPKELEAGIYSQLVTLSPIRAEANVITVGSDDHRWLSSNGRFAGGWVGETDPRPDTATNTFTENRVPMGEIYANPSASQRSLDDLSFDVEGYIAEQVALTFAIAENTAFVKGTGVNQPQGILTTAGIPTIKTGVAAGMPTSGDPFLQRVYGLPSAYRTGSKFLAASTALLSVRTLKTSGTGAYLWQPSLVEGAPETLCGYAIIVAEEMPAGATANDLPVVFGNFKRGYMIADRVGIRTLRDPFSNKPFVSYYSTKRLGGMVRDKAAFISLKCSA